MMKHFSRIAALLLISLLVLPLWGGAAFGAPSAKEKLTGKWQVDIAKSVAIIKDAETAEIIRKAGKAGFGVIMHFKTGGKYQSELMSAGKTDKQSGTWKVLKDEGTSVVIEVVEDESGEKDILQVKLINKDLITLTKRGDKFLLAFRRVTPSRRRRL